MGHWTGRRGSPIRFQDFARQATSGRRTTFTSQVATSAESPQLPRARLAPLDAAGHPDGADIRA